MRSGLLGGGLVRLHGAIDAGSAEHLAAPARPAHFADLLAAAEAHADALHAGVDRTGRLAGTGQARKATGRLVERIVTARAARPQALAVVGERIFAGRTACHESTRPERRERDSNVS